MTLKNDIEKLRDEWNDSPQCVGLDAYIASGLERDNYLAKLADLPEVFEMKTFYTVDGRDIPKERSRLEEVKRGQRRLAALRIYLESQESEAAILERRRDNLALRFFEVRYVDLSPEDRAPIAALIAAEDRAIAAEAEVARMKGEGNDR